MTKTFNFGKSIINNSTYGTFHTNNSTNYSKIIDDIILADIVKKNSYLFKSKNIKENDANTFLNDIGMNTKSYIIDDDFTKAVKFLANYKKYNKTYNLPYTLGKMYTLSDGTPIVFYDDEIQIGFDTYSYSDFTSFNFLNGLNKNTKKIIINIYTNGAKNININLL